MYIFSIKLKIHGIKKNYVIFLDERVNFYQEVAVRGKATACLFHFAMEDCLVSTVSVTSHPTTLAGY